MVISELAFQSWRVCLHLICGLLFGALATPDVSGRDGCDGGRTERSHATADGDDARRIAFLVGVSVYDRQGFRDLDFAEKDVEDLSERLRQLGFETVVLLGSGEPPMRAERETIKRTFEESFLPRLRELKKNDLSVFVFAGHGRHASVETQAGLVEDHFFCPRDSHDSDPLTWLSISEFVRQLEIHSGSERNLVLIDACRDNPSRGRGADGRGFQLNRDAVAILFAASYGEQAWENRDLSHGLFTYYVLEGLTGAASNFDRKVTWDSLVDYVKGRVEAKSTELKAELKISGIQRPNAIGNLRGASPVLVSEDRFSQKAELYPALVDAAQSSPAPEADFLVRHDGGGALLLSEPDFRAFLASAAGELAPTGIGRLVDGTRLVDLKERHDEPIQWVKVKVLDGDLAGKSGWVLQRDVRKP